MFQHSDRRGFTVGLDVEDRISEILRKTTSLSQKFENSSLCGTFCGDMRD
jgi:hypothetical protein